MKILPPAILTLGLLLPSITCSAQTDKKPATDHFVEVIVQAAVEQDLTTSLEALGTLHAKESIELTANVTNKVTRINFDDGQRIRKGHVLVEMTNAEEAALLDEARINADEAKKQLARVESLANKGAAPQSLLDQRQREYQAARSRVLATESRLKDLRLLAPFDGVVGLRNISVGALVTPGDVITQLNDDSQMKLDFTLPAIYLPSLAIGLPIVAISRDLGGRVFTGKVFSIDNQIDPVTRSIKVRALLDNSDRQLKQGMLMAIDVEAGKRRSIVIAETALVSLGSNHFVFVIDQQGQQPARVMRRAIAIGERLPGAVEVLEGLALGEKIVTHGLQKIRTEQQVTISAEQQPVELQSRPQESLSDLLQQAKP
jgi:membrane fusion protein, multidrug efflux system